MEINEKRIVDITKPEDIDKLKTRQLMRFTCKKCGKEVEILFSKPARRNHYKRMLCKRCGMIETNLKKYGYENSFQLLSTQEKIRQTWLKKYGCENPSQSPVVREKTKQTCIGKYGCETPLQSLEIKEKIKRTKFKLYGDINFNNREKTKQTCIRKYGCKNPNQTSTVQEKTKQTCIRKYGCKNPLQSLEIKEKIKRTNIEKYGCENPSQSPVVQQLKLYSKYLYNGIRFDSSWELYYYVYQTQILRNKCIRNCGKIYFEYCVNGDVYRYFPDFITEGKIVEIKGDHMLNKDGTLRNFYNNKYCDGDRLDAKSKCVADNVDEIITRKEITPMIKEVKRLFGVHYIDQFKVNKNEEDLEAS